MFFLPHFYGADTFVYSKSFSDGHCRSLSPYERDRKIPVPGDKILLFITFIYFFIY